MKKNIEMENLKNVIYKYNMSSRMHSSFMQDEYGNGCKNLDDGHLMFYGEKIAIGSDIYGNQPLNRAEELEQLVKDILVICENMEPSETEMVLHRRGSERALSRMIDETGRVCMNRLTSTSKDKDVVTDKFGSVQFEIEIPKGTPILDMKEFPECYADDTFEKEQEVILPPMIYKDVVNDHQTIKVGNPELIDIYKHILNLLHTIKLKNAHKPEYIKSIDSAIMYVKQKSVTKHKGKISPEHKGLKQPPQEVQKQ